MPYPFENNPLNIYLVTLRSLKKQEADLSLIIEAEFTVSEEKLKAMNKRVEVSKEILRLKETCPIKPRKKQVFKNKAELAITRYEVENPRPYAFEDCLHDKKEVRIQVYANNTEHLVVQCTVCGIRIGAKRKKDIPNWRRFNKFDTSLGKKEREKLSNWKSERNLVYQDNIIEGDNIPDFDYEKFDTVYKKENPEPFSSHICNHKYTEKTHRIYENGNDAIVLQCVDCGKHVSNIKKSKKENINALRKFEEKKEKSLYEEYEHWADKRYNELKRKKKEHDAKIRKDIYEGKYVFKVNKTFNTYYDSQQWAWARKKILKRDNHKCQSCNQDATCVHHITYERLGEESHFDLISLCKDCHNAVHYEQDKHYYSFRLTPEEIQQLKKI